MHMLHNIMPCTNNMTYNTKFIRKMDLILIVYNYRIINRTKQKMKRDMRTLWEVMHMSVTLIVMML
jgi:hypothetical protein